LKLLDKPKPNIAVLMAVFSIKSSFHLFDFGVISCLLQSFIFKDKIKGFPLQSSKSIELIIFITQSI
jgi:hypothetical protein